MKVSQINNIGFGNMSKSLEHANRSLLQKTSRLTSLKGPQEVKLAKEAVALYSAENTVIGAAMAQAPGLDELVLSGVEISMATSIYNDIYRFKFSKTIIQSLLTGIIGNRVGTYAFKGATKLVTWTPLAGNILNAGVAGGTTAALGAAIIAQCEEMDKARKRGEDIDKFIKKMNE